MKGAAAAEDALRAGVVVGIDLDTYPDRRYRVNNGTPRPITVQADGKVVTLDLAHTAIIIVDMQNDFCHPDGHFARHGKARGSAAL